MTSESHGTPSDELKPCPFCGGEGAYQTDTEEEGFSEEWIGCLECGAITALEVWNLRALSLTGSGRGVDPTADFARWVEEGPKLAKAAGVYVGIKVYASEDHARKIGDIS